MSVKFSQASVATTNMHRSMERLFMKIGVQRTTLGEFSTLRSLRDTIKTHGMSKPLMAFANHDHSLNRVVTGVPATESLNNVSLSMHDKRYGAAMEGFDNLLTQKPEVISTWVKQLADNLEELFSNTNTVAMQTNETLVELKDELEQRDPPEVLFDTTILTARPAEGMQTILNAIDRRVRQITSIDVDAFFSSTEYREKCTAFINELVEEFKPYIAISLSEDNFVHASDDEIDIPYRAREANLSELGYSGAVLVEILGAAAEVVDALIDFDNRRAAITEALVEVSERLATQPEDMVTETHCLIMNYVTIIVMLMGDSLHHVNEVMHVVSSVLENV